MRVLVSDTSVLVDLERGALLEASFRLPFRYCVPDLLYERELKDHGGPDLLRLGLVVEELDSDGLTEAIAYRRRVPALTLPDSLALTLARKRAWLLLTGDGPLRQLAAAEAVECHGVLWMLDQIHAAGTATTAALHRGLTAISAHPRCRLPRPEVRRRLLLYVGE
ncbi:hypothetical protein [Parvibaculum sp.]|uniref:hypothetical protein n=1 Tax=Parvibaculum sp. TaxID=2024848 RepID=UPI000C3FBAE8|nr:hypothetical protein [Parvibaculum sp.]MAM94928.1 hypothetical protein [Parvibaculum sp.]HCX69000.1 hypothetical protein [Rhodobiaceae bacterium]|tara:strand:- start:6793 stop:7287 length:495 start_codon:yes stop_codon:yes gene_type:complete